MNWNLMEHSNTKFIIIIIISYQVINSSDVNILIIF